jgi:hypothetical protein
MTIKYGQVVAGLETYVRITEAGDTRVTEDGLNTRITNELLNNTAVGVLSATGTYIPYESIVYVNVGGVWKIATVYVKYNGIWQEPQTSYSYLVNEWKRIT